MEAQIELNKIAKKISKITDYECGLEYFGNVATKEQENMFFSDFIKIDYNFTKDNINSIFDWFFEFCERSWDKKGWDKMRRIEKDFIKLLVREGLSF